MGLSPRKQVTLEFALKEITDRQKLVVHGAYDPGTEGEGAAAKGVPNVSYWTNDTVILWKLRPPAALRCGHCGRTFGLPACPECGDVHWYFYKHDRFGHQGPPGPHVIQCASCFAGSTFWVCGGCDGENSVEKTVYGKQSTCFIATAAMESDESPEIAQLSAFRDERLRGSALGDLLIAGYERWSPLAAHWIAKRRTARLLVRAAFVRPLARIVGRLTRRDR